MDFTVARKRIVGWLPGWVKGLLSGVYRFYGLRLVVGPLTYNRDGLATAHNADFIKDPRFRNAYRAGRDTGSWEGDIQWRAHVVCWAARRGTALPGDFVECGVNKGGLALTAMEYVQFCKQAKRFWLLDTFCGLSERYITPEERKHGNRPGGYEPCIDRVRTTFASYENVRIIQGTVPDTLGQVTAEHVAYLSIDMNCVEPEIAALEYFWDKLVSGAAVVLDDYGFRKHILQKQAFDNFARQKDVAILSLPTGQGLILKP